MIVRRKVMRKDFKNIDIYAGIKPVNGTEWLKSNNIEPNWKTPEHIDVRPVYTKEDLEGMEHLDFAAGIPPFLRGPYSMMYPFRPWTIRQYAGFPRSPMLSIVVTWLQDRKVCPWPSTFPHTVVMTPTTPE